MNYLKKYQFKFPHFFYSSFELPMKKNDLQVNNTENTLEAGNNSIIAQSNNIEMADANDGANSDTGDISSNIEPINEISSDNVMHYNLNELNAPFEDENPAQNAIIEDERRDMEYEIATVLSHSDPMETVRERVPSTSVALSFELPSVESPLDERIGHAGNFGCFLRIYQFYSRFVEDYGKNITVNLDIKF